MDAELKRLAAAHGIETRYWDWLGKESTVPRDTVVAVLAAMDVDATTSQAVRDALERADAREVTTLLPPVVTVATMHGPAVVRIAVPEGDDPPEAWLELGSGEVLAPAAASARPHNNGRPSPDARHGPARHRLTEYEFALPAEAPFGWHRLHARHGPHHESAALLLHPGRVREPARRTWGFMTQLYSARSRGSWGAGDLRDLADLASWSGARLGAGFVLVNPLHAGEPVPPISPSPYLPMSRRYTSPLYLRVEDVPGFEALSPEERQRALAAAAAVRARTDAHPAAGGAGPVGAAGATGLAGALDLQGISPIDRDAVWAAQRPALEILHRAPRSADRQESYERFLEREGPSLVNFATWCAIAEEYGSDWRRWPERLHDPLGTEVAAARLRLAERIDFYSWLQWQLDLQLAAAQRAAETAGMPIGIVHDLAVGVHPGGADAWMFQRAFAQGMSVGAPPDEFNQMGQDWGQPPWHPGRLAADAYRPYRELLRHTLRHAGGLRLDHAMQVSRLWWVPEGAGPDKGVYVRYDRPTMLAVLCWEAERAGAVLVGEDLGTVEPQVRHDLADCGIFGTSVLWFERGEQGRPKPPQEWRRACLATVGTHDMPPITGYAHGDHIALRERLGLLTRPASVEWSEHRERLAQWIEVLEELSLLRPGLTVDEAADDPEFVAALHGFLTRTPARLIGVSLADAVGERRTQNQPGTIDEYPNWRVPLADALGRPVLLDDLPGEPLLVERIAPVLDAAGRRPDAGLGTGDAVGGDMGGDTGEGAGTGTGDDDAAAPSTPTERGHHH